MPISRSTAARRMSGRVHTGDANRTPMPQEWPDIVRSLMLLPERARNLTQQAPHAFADAVIAADRLWHWKQKATGAGLAPWQGRSARHLSVDNISVDNILIVDIVSRHARAKRRRHRGHGAAPTGDLSYPRRAGRRGSSWLRDHSGCRRSHRRLDQAEPGHAVSIDSAHARGRADRRDRRTALA